MSDVQLNELKHRAAELQRFALVLDRVFAPRPELRESVTADTLVCRCEDVPFGVLRRYRGWQEAKLQSRCGAGACQGRVCGPALETLLGWKTDGVRPPLTPVPAAVLAAGVQIGAEEPGQELEASHPDGK